MRVIVLDDNRDMLESVRLLLARRGFEVQTCLRAREALEAQRLRPANVLITDIFMPEADGLEVIQQFRARWPDTRIIAVSGGGQKVKGDYLEAARQVGADVALRKPFDPEEFLDMLAGLVPGALPAGEA